MRACLLWCCRPQDPQPMNIHNHHNHHTPAPHCPMLCLSHTLAINLTSRSQLAPDPPIASYPLQYRCTSHGHRALTSLSLNTIATVARSPPETQLQKTADILSPSLPHSHPVHMETHLLLRHMLSSSPHLLQHTPSTLTCSRPLCSATYF